MMPNVYRDSLNSWASLCSAPTYPSITIKPNILIFDEAASNLDQHTAEQFAQTINKLKGKVTILFITHQLPKGLAVDEAILLGKETDVKNIQENNANQQQELDENA